MKTKRKWLAVPGFLAIAASAAMLSAYAGASSSEGNAPTQPIAFPHTVHAGTLKMNCVYCHFSATKSPDPGLPAVGTCMGCHTVVSPQKPEIAKLAGFCTNRKAAIEGHGCSPVESKANCLDGKTRRNYVLGFCLRPFATEQDLDAGPHTAVTQGSIERQLADPFGRVGALQIVHGCSDGVDCLHRWMTAAGETDSNRCAALVKGEPVGSEEGAKAGSVPDELRNFGGLAPIRDERERKFGG